MIVSNAVRKNTRLKEYDYGLAGAYFITICTNDRKNLFWKDLSPLNIYDNPNMKLNGYGEIVRDVWLRAEEIYEDVTLDAYAVMPNHFHGIIIKQESSKRTIANIVNIFKATVTKEIRRHKPNIEVWQRNYHEHVIREKESDQIQYYVMNNPYNFSDDKYSI